MRRVVPLLAALGLLLALPALAAGAQRQQRVVGGTPAADGSYPWTVAIVLAGRTARGGTFCGGTLISRTIVVTASHCVLTEPRLRPQDLRVHSATSRTLPDTTADQYAVTGITVHPAIDRDLGRYDLALLTLAAPGVPAGRAIDLIAPPAFAGLGAGSDLVVAGWGRYDPATQAGIARMQEGTVKRVADADCETVWGRAFTAEDQFCAIGGSPDHPVDTCNGDSGGPIVRSTGGGDKTDPAQWRLVGATSFGSENCDVYESPGVYVRLAAPDVHAFVQRLVDGDPANDPAQLASWASGRPAISAPTAPVPGDRVTCTTGDVVFTPASAAVTLVLRRAGGPDVASGTGSVAHAVTAADGGARFVCEARAQTPDSGPYGDVRESLPTSAVTVPPPAPPAATPAPLPAGPPPVVKTPLPVLRDLRAPSVSAFSRTCTRSRRCTLRLRVTDPAPSFGVGTPTVRLTTRYRARCRRVTCTKRAVRALRARRVGTTSTFVVATGTLRRGRQSLSVTVTDAAGNRRRIPFTASFTLR